MSIPNTIDCDIETCTNTLDLDPYPPGPLGADEVREAAAEHGWTYEDGIDRCRNCSFEREEARR